MKVRRTKRLTLKRVLQILQLRYGTQVQKVIFNCGKYIADDICGEIMSFSRLDVLQIEDKIYSKYGF
jgi:hypothetical protein